MSPPALPVSGTLVQSPVKALNNAVSDYVVVFLMAHLSFDFFHDTLGPEGVEARVGRHRNFLFISTRL